MFVVLHMSNEFVLARKYVHVHFIKAPGIGFINAELVTTAPVCKFIEPD